MFNGFNFAIPALFIAVGTFVVGVIPTLLAWVTVIDPWYVNGRSVIPKALCALTMSICVILTGTVVWFFSPYWVKGPTVWCIFFAVGFVLNVTALIWSYERNAARVAVLVGSIGVAAIHALGLLLFWWGG